MKQFKSKLINLQNYFFRPVESLHFQQPLALASHQSLPLLSFLNMYKIVLQNIFLTSTQQVGQKEPLDITETEVPQKFHGYT